MMLYVNLMCCEYRDISLFTGSKDALCIQPSALEMLVNDKIREPCTSC